MSMIAVKIGIAAAVLLAVVGFACGSDPSPTLQPIVDGTPSSASPASPVPTSTTPLQSGVTPLPSQTPQPPPATVTPSAETPPPSATPELRETSLTLTATKDNTIYEPLIGVIGENSNGQGAFIFAGNNDGGFARRALIAFDLGEQIPAEAIILEATLTMYMSRTRGPEETIEVHRVLRDWGEGPSDGATVKKTEGQGAPAQEGDATWTYATFDAEEWKVPGGDFADAPSTVSSVGDEGEYTWASEQLTADVQMWVEEPSTNFGWVVIGTEDARKTAKRFDSKDNDTEANRPTLTVTFAEPVG